MTKVQNCTPTIIATALPPSTGLPSQVMRLRKLVRSWAARSRQRHDLAKLDDASLRDIGLTRSDVDHEISKPFWQL